MKKFRVKGNMENHFAVTHTKSKDKWKCQLCSKDYCTLESFKTHYKGYCKPPMANLGSVLSEESGDRDAMQVDEPSKTKGIRRVFLLLIIIWVQ